MDIPAQRSPRFTLFVTILSLFLCAALLVGAGVTAAGYIENRKNALKVAGDTFAEKIGRINERRLAFFAPSFLLLQQFHGHQALREGDGSRDAILKLVLPA